MNIFTNEFHAVKATAFQSLEEVQPTGFVFFHALCDAQYFPVTVFINGDCSQNADILMERYL